MAYRLAPQAEADLEEIALYVFHETAISKSPIVWCS
jgi:plasmid stabilization system protein ParE